jgi:hypothetical protein
MGKRIAPKKKEKMHVMIESVYYHANFMVYSGEQVNES